MIPGELVVKDEDVICNAGRKGAKVTVKNTGDRPIQVGSHYHFYEVNKALDFDRSQAFGMRLNIMSSAAVRFEPGEQKEVALVEFGGKKNIFGFNNLTDGNAANPAIRASAKSKAVAKGYKGS